ncbi:MAG: glycoside hydrolase family 127 protein [Eubacterium sp.]|nr:glycoside hydrolase family 127 protein [Eubacterium sp.]
MNEFGRPIKPSDIKIRDSFWAREIDLVRDVVIPYQWDILNDRVKDASPSFVIHNFNAARRMNKLRTESPEFEEPAYTFRGFEVLPEDKDNPDPDKFYGFVFQDSDLYKFLEAVSYSLEISPDEKLEALADQVIDLIGDAQLENGYLDTYYILSGMDKSLTNLRDHHELYCLGHMIEGAVAYYEATGKDKFMKVAARYADYIDEKIGPEEGKLRGYPGHEIAEMALIRLYEATGIDKYLKLASYFIDERGKQPYYFDNEHKPENGAPLIRYHYHQAHLPVRQQTEAVGHAVRAVYLYSGMADMYRHSKDESLLNACKILWDSIVNTKMYLTGGIGATHIGESFSFLFDLPNDIAYTETCAAIGLVFFARRMLQVEPDIRYSDIMELALYNGVLSGISLDGRSFFYTNPLEVLPNACKNDERKFHIKPVRQKWFGCACCPPNIARLLTSIGSYAYTEQADRLFIHLYMTSSLQVKTSGGIYRVEVESSIIEDGNVTIKCIKIENESPVDNGDNNIDKNQKDKNNINNIIEASKLNLGIRIPGWAKKDYSVEGLEDRETYVEKGYLYASDLEDGDQIRLHFAIKPRLIMSNENVFENEGKLAVKRGPIVYCAEEADNGDKLWRLRIDTEGQIKESRETFGDVEATFLDVDGYRLRARAEEDDNALYREYVQDIKEKTQIRMIPYFLWANRGEGEMSVYLRGI